MIGKNSGVPQQQVYTDLSSLQKIKVQGNTDKGAALQSIAKQFESIMVQQMMKSMRQANEAFAEGDMTSSSEEKFYRDMFDSQLSLTLSQGRGFGLAEAMMRQFHGKLAAAVADRNGAPGADSLNNDPSNTDPLNADVLRSGAAKNGELKSSDLSSVTRQQTLGAWARPEDMEASAAFTEAVYRLFQDQGAYTKETHKEAAHTAVDPALLDGTPESFVKVLRPAAERIANQLGVDSRILLSQAALETGWGQKVIQRGGVSSFNFFNIKAGSNWQGATISVPTIEYQNGVAVREVASFRAYRSPEESFSDYANLIAENPRYEQALQRGGNAAAYIKALAAAGYATDPRYADKVLALFNGQQINAEQINGNQINNEKLNGDRLDGATASTDFAELDQL